MRSTNWKGIAELIGIAAIVGSLIFVGIQLRQSQQIGISDVVANRSERQNALRTQIIENAAIWHKACADDPLTPEERVIAATIFDTYMENVLYNWITSSQGLISSDVIELQMIENVALQLWVFPGLEELRKSRATFTELRQASAIDGWVLQLYRGINNKLNELKDSGSPPEVAIGLCGNF